MSAAEPLHLRPTAPLAPRVLLPGDPGRALALAQVVLGDDRKMFHHHRGLWGYTGTAADGEPLTIQSTGIGGPSGAVVFEELARLGARRAIRVGTARGLQDGVQPGALLAVTEVHALDGTSRALAAPETMPLAFADTLAADARGPIVSHDALYAPDLDAQAAQWRAAGLHAADLETAALASVALRHGIAFGAILILDGHRLDDDALTRAGERAGRAAADCLQEVGG
ncbi:phosphorylase family protein [Baekduia sp. Peel2402]|uniref:phosphorylase family protein n=1 Tax=Baekduia sp. Peel2402 TaxID=3458296 RepID=UPI00403E9213